MTNQPESKGAHESVSDETISDNEETHPNLAPEVAEFRTHGTPGSKVYNAEIEADIVVDPDEQDAFPAHTEAPVKHVSPFTTRPLEPESVPSNDHMPAEAAIKWAIENECVWDHAYQSLHHPRAGVHVQGEPFVFAVGRLVRHTAQLPKAEG